MEIEKIKATVLNLKPGDSLIVRVPLRYCHRDTLITLEAMLRQTLGVPVAIVPAEWIAEISVAEGVQGPWELRR